MSPFDPCRVSKQNTLTRAAAPVLVALAAALLAWALSAAGGAGPLLAAPSRLATPAELAAVFVPALTAQVGYWATLALNIADFSRCAAPLYLYRWWRMCWG